MGFADKNLICVDCGKPFLWDAGEQAWYRARRFEHEPKRCKPCRERRRDERLSQMQPIARVNCARCGNPIYVSFVPRGTKPVYCRMCLASS